MPISLKWCRSARLCSRVGFLPGLERRRRRPEADQRPPLRPADSRLHFASLQPASKTTPHDGDKQISIPNMQNPPRFFSKHVSPLSDWHLSNRQPNKSTNCEENITKAPKMYKKVINSYKCIFI